MEEFIKSFMKTITCCDLETGDFPGPIVTISRQSGCSAQRIAIKLSKILTGYSYMSDTKTDAEWKWVDKNIFKDVVDDIIEEVKKGNYDDADEAIKMLHQVAKAFSNETIYEISDESLIETFKGVVCRLACKGRTIIVGRSAGIILKDIPNKLNVRLEAPMEWRINRIMQLRDFSQAEAVRYVKEMDEKRDSFIERIIGRKANNEDFDVIFNYASLQDDEIIDAMVNILKNKNIIAQHEEY
ncbi:Cytidylate kinase-like family protein [Mariniphaga anaerophila]|uniref:Cytidylate kinase-like family protein n=1 Tax=Mariniphaga anaerophila TaxID=1484053 RepID=A0A1M4W9B9_9BACT|nr:cytidylate kinase-like family protein [Mariniphaga anaerophila]SHE77562.1 Cytidylate kinase-like family protein [Mariniphaga anaerophila]